MSRVRADVNQARRHYLQVLEFTDGDPLEDEIREYVPRPPLEEVNRLRGRIAFERTAIIDHDSAAASSSENGAVIRIDWSRIGGSYWTLTGYWRGSLTSTPIGRADHAARPDEPHVPDRPVLCQSEIALEIRRRPPDSAVGQQPGRDRWRICGAESVAQGDCRDVRRNQSRPDPVELRPQPADRPGLRQLSRPAATTASTGAAPPASLSAASTGGPERQYLFVENNYSIGRTFSIFQTAQADYRDPKLMNGATGAQLSQSFITVRYTPRKRISFDVSDNYFRGVPTFDQRLIGTGLLDQYLFTGISGGVRVEPIDNLMITANFGNSRRNGDTSHAVNQAYGITWKHLPILDLRLDLRYNSFSSSFGTGSYESAGITRELSDTLRLQFEAGIQNTQSFIPARRAPDSSIR